MIESVHPVGFGRVATAALARAVTEAKVTGPLAPVTVVVSSNFVALSLRRLVASGELGGTGLANVSFLTPLQLVEQLSPASSGPPLTNPVLGAVVRRALAEDPGPFGDVAEHPATEAAVAALYAELSHVSPATLDALAEAGGIAAVSVRLVRRITEHLGPFSGEAETAMAVARRNDLAAAAAPLGHLVWHLPEPLTPSLERAMAALTAALPTTVVVGLTGVATADEATVAMCRRLAIDLPAIAPPDPPVASRVVSAPDPDEEVRAAVRWVLELAGQGVALDRIAIFYPVADPYVRSLEQHLAEAGIPASGPTRERLADSVAGRTLLSALHLPEHRWRRDEVMALVAGAPVRSAAGPAHPAAWEVLSRRAGVVQGLDDWRRKLGAHRASLLERIEATASDPERGTRLQGELDDLDDLAGFVDTLARSVQAVVGARGWSAKVDAANALLSTLLGPEPRHHRWPDAEQEAAARVVDVLARLAPLDDLDPDPSFSVFLRALSHELEAGRGRRGRVGEGVLYGPLTSAPGQDHDAVVVLGLVEGTCPAVRRDDSLLPDRARALAPDGELVPRSQRIGDQHRALLAALAAAPAERRTITMARGTMRGRAVHLPSRWLLDSVAASVGHRVDTAELTRLGPPHVEVVGSHAEGIRTATVPLSITERDLAELTRLVESGGDPRLHPAAAEAGRGITCLASRRSHRFTEWDGNLAGMPVPSPTGSGDPLSPTGLQEWAACGFRYYLSHVLHLRDRDEPERIRELSPLDRGSGVHRILERFLLEVIEQDPPGPDTLWTAAQRARLQEIAAEVFDELERTGRTGRPVTWRIERARLSRMLDEFLSHDEQRRAEWRSRPVRVELPFGLDGVDPVVVSLPDGRVIRFRGMADRVDRTDDGRWVILDYKTGSGAAYQGLADDPFSGGSTLQLALYAEAARQRLGGDAAAAYYWMVDQGAGYAVHGYEWTPELRAQFVDLVATMVDGIDGGVFPAVPGEWNHFRNTHDTCAFCPFDRVCPSERGTYAEAKFDAPELAVRARLSQPATPDEELDQ